jgi:hypothetical protein
MDNGAPAPSLEGKWYARRHGAKMIKVAGYKWRNAKIVLTSNDPTYKEKLARIRYILSSLQPDEAFFSIDEYGPFAIKAKPGRTLSAPGVQPTVPQWQKSRGCIIMTAALELSGNQVTHFYSAKKNTTEMIRMLDVLIDRYSGRRKLYLSWDAAHGTFQNNFLLVSTLTTQLFLIKGARSSRLRHYPQALNS